MSLPDQFTDITVHARAPISEVPSNISNMIQTFKRKRSWLAYGDLRHHTVCPCSLDPFCRVSYVKIGPRLVVYTVSLHNGVPMEHIPTMI